MNPDTSSITERTDGKIKSVEELAGLVAAAKAEGKTVVMAGGVFDVFHYGHLRHLRAARQEGDLLLVAVTADAHAGKAPGRPVFNEHMRTEMLASQDIVEWVVINRDPGAERLLTELKPDVYVKGSEYAHPEDDVTGRIITEREAAESYGGRIVFTDEVTFSSSALINEHLNIFDPPLREYLNEMRQNGGLKQILGHLDKVKDYRVLVVGDMIVDDYVYVNPMGKSPKDNIIATRYEEDEVFAGGVIAAANHVAGICASVDVVTILGAVNSYRDLVEDSIKENISLMVLTRPSAPTTRKQRFIEPSYVEKMFEVYFMDDTPLPAEVEMELNEFLEKKAADYDLVIVTDFGHGMLQPSTIKLLTQKAKFLAVNAQSNSANLGYNLITRYSRADFVCIDTHEACLASGNKFKEVTDIIKDDLARQIKCDKFAVTLGKEGCITYETGQDPYFIPAFSSSPIDTVGAGDAFFAVSAPIVACGAGMNDVGFIANIAGALKIGIVGHRMSIEKENLVKTATALLK